MGRVLYHLAGAAFLAWVVLVAAKWFFVGGLAAFGLYAWDSRPGGEERMRHAEQMRRERPIPPEGRVRDAVQRSSTITLRLIERRWLVGTVAADNPTEAAVDLSAVFCRVLFAPDVGRRHEMANRGPWRVRVEPGATYRGEVSFYESDVSASGSPTALAEYRCRLDVRVVPAPDASPGSPSNPIRMTPTGYRSAGGR